MPVLVALDDAEDALLRQQLRAIGAGHRLALVGRHVLGLLRRHRAAGAQCTDDVRHAPDRVLVGDEDLVAPQREAIRPVEVLDMPVDPFGAPLAVVAQQGQIAGALLGDQYVAVGQYEQPPRIYETGHERRRGEARRHLQLLPVKGHDQRPVGDDRPGLWRRQIIGVEMVAPPDLVLGLEILRQLFFCNRALSRRRRLLCGGRRQRQHGGGACRQRNQ